MGSEKTDPYHHGDLRRALLDSAEDLLQSVGAEGVTLRAVAREAGVSHAAPYRHFASKENLLAEVARAGFDRLQHRLETAGRQSTDPLDRIRAAGAAYVRFAVERPAHFGLMFGPYIVDYAGHPQLTESAGRAFEVLVRLIADGQAEGRVRKDSPRLLATSAWSAVHGLAMLINGGRLAADAAAVEAQIDAVTLSVVDGIGSR